MRQYIHLGGLAGGKKRKKVDIGADGGQLVRDDGQGWRRGRRRRGVAGLEAAMVRNKSKIKGAPLFCGGGGGDGDLFCTDGGIAPADGFRGEPGRRLRHLHAAGAEESQGAAAAILAGWRMAGIGIPPFGFL